MVNRFDEGGFRGFGSPGLFGGFGGPAPFRGFGGSTRGSGDEPFSEDFIRSTFQGDPGKAFETRLGQAGLSRSMVDFFRQKSGRFLADFNAAQGRRFLESGLDTNPLDFFGNLDFRVEALKFSPKARDEGIALQNPRTRFFR